MKSLHNNRINVLYVDENQDGTVGGSHTCLLDMVQTLNKKEFKVMVMFYEDNCMVDEFIKIGASVTIYRKPSAINLNDKLRRGGVDSSVIVRFLVATFQKVLNVIRTDFIPCLYSLGMILKHNIHIIHINNSIFFGRQWVIAAKVLRRIVIGHQRGYFHAIPRCSGAHSRCYDYVLGTSISIRDNLVTLGIDVSNYATFYDRVNVERLRSALKGTSAAIRNEFLVTDGQPLIGIIGNLKRWKGQMTVIEALNLLYPKYRNIRCLLVGDVSVKANEDIQYHGELLDKIRIYGLQENVVLTGYREDVPDILNALDVFIHASTDPEPYGLVVLEAMAMSKPVIASNLGGPSEMIVNGRSGILVEPNNPHALSKALDTLLSDNNLRDTLGANASRRVNEKFAAIDIMFIENLYCSLLGRRRSA